MLVRTLLAVSALALLTSSALARTSPSEATQARAFPPPPIQARAAVVMDAANGAVLAAKNPHLRLPMASTTKIMTALLALQMGHLSDRVTVPRAAFNFESDATVMGLHPGQVVTLKDLLYGLMLPSGADAANTIAIHYGGSESRFVALMNGTAAMLGLKDTHFANAHGLPASHHYTTAQDLATLAQYVSYFPDLMAIARAHSYRWNGHVLTNLNKVLFWYPGADGIKPGYTDEAGICQVLDAQRHGRHVVAAILNTPNLDTDARNLLNFGLQDFSWVTSPLPHDSPAAVMDTHDPHGPSMYFVGAGHYVRGAFWHAFMVAGGVAALGFPRTEALQEGHSQVQFFQNGALSYGGTGTSPSRLALNLTPLPTPQPTSSPTAITTPQEGVIPGPGRTSTPRPARSPAPTRTPRPTPVPRAATPAPRPVPSVAVDARFVAFQRAHDALLGHAIARAYHRHGYTVQVFAYSALVYDPDKHAVALLPAGDRMLAARGFLPAYPGNMYPAGFASSTILKAIDWPAVRGR